VILIDVNLLAYAILESYGEHARARAWLYEQIRGTPRIGLPWHSVLGFVRVTSDRRYQPAPISLDDAWNTARGWLALPNVWVPSPTERHEEIISNLIATTKVGAKDVMDLHLAALAIEHGLTLCSADTGFERYRGLRLLNPLSA
jgi:toxin-antitoxin system PIN domain toxin